jgi:hypothetical protein
MNEAYQSQPVTLDKMNRQVNRCLRAKADDLSLSLESRRCRRLGIIGLCGLMFFLFGNQTMHAQTSMSEYQVKALFLLNFVKYVDWPAGTSGPITIGILGQDNFGDSLARAVDGKTVNGRAISIKHFSLGESLSGCAILFISASENSQLSAILSKTGSMPILTVGESESFLQNGGIINFMLIDGKIHLAINLKTAQKANLQISSKLLSVADVVAK